MSDERPKLGPFPYVIGGLSYIPLIGIVFGGLALVWGLVTKKSGGRLLAVIGAGGIAFTIILYGALFFGLAPRGGIQDDLRSKLAATSLTSLVNAIETHRLQTGRYPDSLETLLQSLPEDSPVYVIVLDPTVRMDGTSGYFHYERVDADHYYLLSVGPDGQPFTPDDILPNVEVQPGSKLGFLIKRAARDGP